MQEAKVSSPAKHQPPTPFHAHVKPITNKAIKNFLDLSYFETFR